MKRSKKLISLWLCASVLLMLLAACGSTVSSTPPTASSVSNPTSAPATTVAATTAPASTTAALAANTPVAALKPGIKQNSAPGTIANVVYSTADGLYAYNIATAKTFQLTSGRILKFVVSPDNRRVAFYSVTDYKIALNEVIFHGDSASEPILLDANVGNYLPPSDDTSPYKYSYLRAYTMTFSSDSNLIAYSRANPNGPTFKEWHVDTKPTEVWLADAQAYTVRRLAPNNAPDFMYHVKFSTDDGRVGFIKTAGFPSDVRGNDAVWSVHTDGTKLTVLQEGAPLSKLAGTSMDDPSIPPIGMIHDFFWTNPLGVTFTVLGLLGDSSWIHDLNTGKARELFGGSFETMGNYEYDEVSHRYAYISGNQLFTIGTASAQDKPVLVTSSFKKLVNFYDNSVLFLNNANKVIVQSVNDNGSLVGVALGLPKLYNDDDYIAQVIPAYGAWIVAWQPKGKTSSLTISVFSGDGKSVILQPVTITDPEYIPYMPIKSLSDDTFVVQAYSSVSLLDLSGDSPVFTTLYQK